MWRFIFGRLLHTAPVLLGVSIVVFSLAHMVPGDIAQIMLPAEATPDDVSRLRQHYGLDRPLHEQYVRWLMHALGGDLGVSAYSGVPVAQELGGALGYTLLLAIPAALAGFGLGVAFGTIAAFHHGRAVDRIFSALAIAGVSLPVYWVGIVLVVVFAVVLNWLPAMGAPAAGQALGWEEARHLVLPVLTLSLVPMGVVGRLTRASVLEVLGQEFVTALRARGLPLRAVVRHVGRNASPPVVALMGLQLGYLLGGAILVEVVFNWPGTGLLMNLAIFRRDVPVLQGTILALAALFVVINLAVDVLQAALDPRIRR